MTPRLSQGDLQVESAQTSHAEEIVQPGVIQSTPDGKVDKLL